METLEKYSLLLREPIDAAEARRAAGRLGDALEFSATQNGRLAIIATELATNMLKYARGGRMLVRQIRWGANLGVELICMDEGPGLKDLDRAFEDGFSTSGSPGTGLGAVKRLSAWFDFRSDPKRGLVQAARIWADPGFAIEAADGQRFSCSGVSVPNDGESVCGDAWRVRRLRGSLLVAVADGLGHGPFAAEAAEQAMLVFDRVETTAPVEIVEAMRGPLRATRGAAVAVAHLDPADNSARYCGVGNIEAAAHNQGAMKRYVSSNGIVGHTPQKPREYREDWIPGSTLVIHTDGLKTNWSMSDHAGLLNCDPSLIAATLVRDHTRGRDDATAVVIRDAASERAA